MQKNKFIHEDIKAVCSSATKKLIACGLVVAVNGGNIVNAQTREFDAQKQLKKELQVEETTAVRSVSNTANSQSRSDVLPRASGGSATTVTENASNLVLNEQVQEQPNTSAPAVASEQTPEGNEPNKPEEQKPRHLTEEEAREVIAKGLGNYSSWEDLCADNNLAFDDLFFEAEANRLMALLKAKTEKIEEAIEETEEKFEKQQEEVKELQIKIDEQGRQIEQNGQELSEFVANQIGHYEQGDEYNANHTGTKFPEHYLSEFTPFAVAARNAHPVRLKLEYLQRKIKEYNDKLLEKKGWFSATRPSLETLLTPPIPEPKNSRFVAARADEWIKWAEPETERLEKVARLLLQECETAKILDDKEKRCFNWVMFDFKDKWAARGIAVNIKLHDKKRLCHCSNDEILAFENDLEKNMKENLEIFRIPVIQMDISSQENETDPTRTMPREGIREEDHNPENNNQPAPQQGNAIKKVMRKVSSFFGVSNE